MSFESLGLVEPILSGIRAAGYESPTDIQKQAIPIALRGKNLIALGQTGSGKTAAFGLPLLQRLAAGPTGLRAVILVPTRELCVQVAESLRLYGQAAGLGVCTAFGGVPMNVQESAFKRGLDVVVACPGRLIDHLERGNLTLTDLQVLVLDEADRMLDMGFMPQIHRILRRCPQERQNLLFSATLPPEVEALCKEFIGDAERVQVGQRSQAASTIKHRFQAVAETEKPQLLAQTLRDQRGRVLIFVRTKLRAEQLGNKLKRDGLPADSIHGDKEASTRYSILQAFDRGKLRYLVATDVAARGIDVDDIELVVNYDIPRALEDYIHRVGRTGRAGAKGCALTFVSRAERGMYETILAHLKKGRGRDSDAGTTTSAPDAEVAERDDGRERDAVRPAPRSAPHGVLTPVEAVGAGADTRRRGPRGPRRARDGAVAGPQPTTIPSGARPMPRHALPAGRDARAVRG